MDSSITFASAYFDVLLNNIAKMTIFNILLILLVLMQSCKGQACDETLEDHHGTIQSPRYPFNYPNRRKCTWKVKIAETSRINLTFTDFELYPGCHDFLELWDGGNNSSPFVAKLCPTSLDMLEDQTYISTGNMFFMRFTSNIRHKAKGFSANYYSIPEVTSTTMQTTPVAPTTSVVSTRVPTSTVKVIPTSAQYTATAPAFTDVSYSSSPVTTEVESMTSDIPENTNFSKVIIVTFITGLLIFMSFVVGLVICCTCKSNERKPSGSGGNGQYIDKVTDPDTYRNEGFEVTDGYTALRISGIDFRTSKEVINGDIKTDSEMMSTSSFQVTNYENKPDQVEKRKQSNTEISESDGADGEEEFVENVVYESCDREESNGQYGDIERKGGKEDNGLSGERVNGKMVVGHESKEEEGMIDNVVYERYDHGERGETVNGEIFKGYESNNESEEGSVNNVLYESYEQGEQDKDLQPEKSGIKKNNPEKEDGPNAIYENYQRNGQEENEYENVIIE